MVASTPLTVCASCGVACAREGKCSHCHKVHEDRPRVVPPRADGAFWVCAECFFTCRACGFRVPLNHLDMDGAVLCVRCGLEQAFDVPLWRKALVHAHAVGDVSLDRAPEIAGDRNPFRDVGVSRTGDTLRTTGPNAFEVTASPGCPLCPTCHDALDVGFTHEGRSTATCHGCGAVAEHEMPAAARKMAHGLRAVLAAEHRTDRKQVSVEETGSAIVVKCPSCSGPLDVASDSKFVTCKFCNIPARIPDRTWARLSKSTTASESIWLLFEGASPMRQAFEARAKLDADDARRRAEENARREEDERTRAAAEAAYWARKHAEKEAQQAAVVRRRKRAAVLYLAAAVFVGLVIVSFITVITLMGRSTPPDNPRPPVSPPSQRR